MKMMRKALAAAVLLAVGAQAGAVSLTPDVVTPLPGTTVAAQPQLAGTVLEDDIQPFAFSAYGGLVTGTVQSRVVRSSVDGTLDFYWRINNDAGSAGALTAFRIGQFVTANYDANWRIDGLGDTAPVAARLFSSPANAVNFLFETPSGSALESGGGSYFLLLDTDATAYARTGVYDLTTHENGSISNSFTTFAPAVPEPASAFMMVAGLGALALLRKRRA